MPRHLAIGVLFFTAMSAAFSFVPIEASTGVVEPSGILMSMNERAYVVGETVTASGRVEPPLDLNNDLRMTVYSPDGEIFNIDEFKLNNDGGFTWSFNLPPQGIGEWVVNAKFSTKEAEATITVLGTDLFDKVLMETPTVVDSIGNAIVSREVRIGESIGISATLINDEQESQEFMFIVQVINEEKVVNSVLLSLGMLQPKETASSSVSWLPSEPGEYSAEVFVWSSLNNAMPLVEKQAFTFRVNA